jgi:hypothetical protein
MVMAGNSSKKGSRERGSRRPGNQTDYFGVVAKVSTAEWMRQPVSRGHVNFSYVWVGCIFHAASRFGLEGLAFFD